MSGDSLLLLITLVVIVVAMLRQQHRKSEVDCIPEIEVAVRKAAELNRPAYFIPGSRDIDNIQTISALSMLKVVARYCAEYDVELIIPVNKSMVMERAQEVCRTAYQKAGFADRWSSSQVSYTTDDPLGFVAHVDGMIARAKPAVCFMFGFFAGESLLLAESSYNVAEVTIAGTAVPSQLPFFVASCDTTLIGEEFFAASAMLSGNKEDIAMLQGLDAGKQLAIGIILAVVVLSYLTLIFKPEMYKSLLTIVDNLLHGGGR